MKIENNEAIRNNIMHILYEAIELLERAYEISDYANIVGAKINIAKAKRDIINTIHKELKHERS